MKLKLHFYFCLIVFSISASYSQSYEKFSYSIKTDDNTFLTSNLFIDHNGFTWYATKDRVVKDFGSSKMYILLTPNSNKPIYVNAFLQDDDLNIWALTPSDIYIINYNDHGVKTIGTDVIKNSLNFDMYVSIIQQKKNDHIWISTRNNHIFEFKGTTLLNSYFIDDNQKDDIFLLSLNKKDEVVMISEHFVYKIKDNKLQLITTKTSKDILISLKSPSKEIINKKGVVHYNKKKIPYSYFPEIDMYKIHFKDWNIDRLLNSRRNNLTWGIKNNELHTAHKSNIWSQQFQFKNKQWYLNDLFKINIQANIASITQDSLSNYIISSNGSNIHKIRKDNRFHTTYLKDSVSNISTRAIISDSKKNLFIASYNGLFKIDSLGTTYNISKNTIDNNIYTFLRKNDSVTWSNYSYFFKKSNLLNNTFRFFEQNKWAEISQGIISLAYKNDSQIWIGTLKGLYFFDEKKESFTDCSQLNKDYSLKDTYINDILQLPNNDVWLGTDNGAYLYNSKTKKVTHYSSKSKNHKIPHTIVLDIHKDKYNTIWLAGNKGLVSIKKSGKIKQYLKKEGLVNNIVCSILETPKHLWVGTYDGISRVNLTGSGKHFSNYLKGHEFNHSSSYKLNDSTLLFGSTNGVYKIFAKKVPKRHMSQKLIPVSLKTYQKDKDSIIEEFSIKNLKSIELECNSNYFEFKFALNNSFNHKKNNFLYKIEGLTNSWISLGNSTIIRQYGIPSGKYVLKVKGVNEEGMKSVNEISIPIIVSQIFYKTTGFILSVILLMLSGILLTFFRIKRRNKRERNLKSNIKELKIKALTMQMNPHFIFNIINNIQSDLILKSTININDYIHAFSSLLRTTMNMTTSYSISLKNEIDYLEAYIKLQEYRLNNNFSHKIEIINTIENVDIDTLKIPCMLLQPIVENAILHGLESKEDSNKLLKITFTISEVLEIVIEDNGVGRKKNSSTLSGDDTPHAMGLMKTRVSLRNELEQNRISFHIIDLVDGNTPLGTKVVFKISLKHLS